LSADGDHPRTRKRLRTFRWDLCASPLPLRQPQTAGSWARGSWVNIANKSAQICPRAYRKPQWNSMLQRF